MYCGRPVSQAATVEPDSNGGNMTLTKEAADQIYTILVEEAGALERGRSDFTHYQTHNHCDEWRFCGLLGFGGKFWRAQDRWYVTCYLEDETVERKAIVERTNKRLLSIKPK